MKHLPARTDPDAIDLDEMLAAYDSPGWRRFQNHLLDTRRGELAKLATVGSWDDARFQQGVLAGMQTALDIPKILIDQARKKLTHKDPRS